jgi:hypothetical protein
MEVKPQVEPSMQEGKTSKLPFHFSVAKGLENPVV